MEKSLSSRIEMPSSVLAPGLRPAPLSKVSPPSLININPRPRLQELFRHNEDKKLVLILGQSAQGKSTAAAGYFQTCASPAVWINLEPEDSDPVNLFCLLVQSLGRGLADQETATLFSLPPRTVGPRDILYCYREWATSLFKAFPLPGRIFLDGLDHLNPQAESFLLLQVMIEVMPPSARFVLLSRVYPPLTLEFQKLKMDREALVLNNADLAFSPREIGEFFRKTHRLSLSTGSMKYIHQVTEGWIGGIILLAELLSRSSRDSQETLLDRPFTERFYQETFQYFGKEVFQTLPAAHQDFLLRSSILENLSPKMMRDLFPREDGEALLKELTRKNLFVQAFPDAERGFVFRYHNLFKEFLNNLLRSRFSEEEQSRWHLRVGEYCQKKINAEEAITHYLQARAYPEAAGLIRQEGLKHIRTGRLDELFHWLQGLPEAIIREDPWLTLFQTLPQRFLALEENIRVFEQAIARFQEQGDQSGLLLGLAYLLEANFFQGKYSPELIRKAEDLLELSPKDTGLYEQALLWTQVGITQTLRGNARRGYWACRNAYLLGRQTADRPLQAVALCHGIYSLTILGEFREADRLLKEADSFLWGLPNAEIRFFYFLSKATYLIFKGEAQSALELCHNLAEETENKGLSYLYPVALLHQQLALVYLQEYGQVEQIGSRISTLAAALKLDFLKGAAQFFSGLATYWSDRCAEARSLIAQSLALFETGSAYSELHQVGARLARALLNDHPDQRAAAIQDIREVTQYLERIESHLLLTEGHLTLGLLFHDQGQTEAAKDHLKKGLDLARRRGFRHFMIISPRDTVRACLLAQEYFESGNDAAAYGADLLVQKYGRLAPEKLEKQADHPSPPVSRTVQAIRRSIHRANKPVLRIETFGGLQLYFDNHKMDELDWGRRQPRRLLAAILSQTNEKTLKDVLIEELWPEENPGIGENTFKTTLQRLRKTLEKDMSKEFGSSYIHLHHNTVYLDEALCRIDAKEFTVLYREGKELEKIGEGQKALENYSKAIDLYRGDFLPEERYAPRMEYRRDDFRNTYIDLLNRSVHYYEQAGNFKKAEACLKQVIGVDPLLEEAYRALMSLYDGKRRYNDAVRVFDSCKKALRSGLNTRPDPLTMALYQGIKERQKKS